MPEYSFWCDICGYKRDIYVKSWSERPQEGSIICKCGTQMYREFGTRVDAFKPYVEANFNGKPTEITTKEQRDKLCAEHNCSYDSYKYTIQHRKNKHKHSIDEVGFNTWAKEMKKNGVF